VYTVYKYFLLLSDHNHTATVLASGWPDYRSAWPRANTAIVGPVRELTSWLVRGCWLHWRREGRCRDQAGQYWSWDVSQTARTTSGLWGHQQNELQL